MLKLCSGHFFAPCSWISARPFGDVGEPFLEGGEGV
jgi:hypothetical protein